MSLLSTVLKKPVAKTTKISIEFGEQFARRGLFLNDKLIPVRLLKPLEDIMTGWQNGATYPNNYDWKDAYDKIMRDIANFSIGSMQDAINTVENKKAS